MATPTRYPGWRHMTGAQRYNARMSALFERAMALRAGQCTHNEMVATGNPTHAWRCATCDYVYGQAALAAQ